MAKKGELLFYLEDGTPVYAADAPVNSVASRRFGDAKPPKAAPPVVTGNPARRFGDAPSPAPTMATLMPFSDTSEPEQHSGNAKLAVDYSKDPYSTTVPGQPGYDQSKDPFHQTPEQKAKSAEAQAAAEKLRKLYERSPSGEWWQKSRGEKTGGSGLDSVHSDAADARRLQRQLDDERKYAESLYPGAGGRQHSAGGTNLGEPSWSGSGGGAFHQGATEWVTRSGTVVGQNGVELVQVLESWNIYNGQ